MKTLLAIALIMLTSCCTPKLLETGYDSTQEFWYIPAENQTVAREFYFGAIDSLGGFNPINESRAWMLTMDKYGKPVRVDGEKVEF